MATLLEGWVVNPPGVKVCGIASEAGRVEAGYAWVDLENGRHAQLAKARGASIVISPEHIRKQEPGMPSLGVPGLRQRLPELAARFWRHPADQVSIAALPRNGSSRAVSHYLSQSWLRSDGGPTQRDHGMSEGFPCHVQAAGIEDPFSLQERLHRSLDAGVRHLAMEVSRDGLERGWFDQMALEVAVFCSDGQDNAWTRPLFTRCKPRFAVVDHDVPEGKSLTRLMAPDVQVLTYGTNGSTELQGSWLGMDSSGMTVRITSPWGGGQVQTGLMGRRNLSALLAAAGTLALAGMPWARVMHQLEIMAAVPGHLKRIGGEPGQPTAVIDHARSAAALEDVLVALRSHLHGRLSCVLPHSMTGERRMMRVARSLADEVFDARPTDREQVIQEVVRDGGSNDIVLIIGPPEQGVGRDEEYSVRRLMEAVA